MTGLAAIVMMLAVMLAVTDWRKGLALCVLVGVLQDPLRKLAPNQPVYYVVLVGVVFAATWLRAYSRRVPLSPNSIEGWRKHLSLPFGMFVFLMIGQAMHSFVLFRNPAVSAIGLLVWLAPIPAVVLAYQYALRSGLMGVRRWMRFYIWTALAALAGVYLEYAGFEWATLGEVGTGLLIYDVGTVLKAYSGFFRSSEIAAWHTATIACFIFGLSVGKRTTLGRVALALAVIALLASMGLLTGRRKLLVQITVFLSVYFFLVAWLQRGAQRLALLLLVVGGVGFLSIIAFMAPDLSQRTSNRSNLSIEEASRIQGYAERGQSVFADVPSRLTATGFKPIQWAVNSHGWFGAGLGTGTQGAKDMLPEGSVDRGPSEGGLGKITLELGVPGLFIALWLAVALAKHIYRALRMVSRISADHARMSYTFAAVLLANAATFAVATQAYSDLFALLVLGWSLGFLLAMPALAAAGDRLKRRGSGHSVPPAGEDTVPLHSSTAFMSTRAEL
jgi:hypothetical protein